MVTNWMCLGNGWHVYKGFNAVKTTGKTQAFCGFQNGEWRAREVFAPQHFTVFLQDSASREHMKQPQMYYHLYYPSGSRTDKYPRPGVRMGHPGYRGQGRQARYRLFTFRLPISINLQRVNPAWQLPALSGGLFRGTSLRTDGLSQNLLVMERRYISLSLSVQGK